MKTKTFKKERKKIGIKIMNKKAKGNTEVNNSNPILSILQFILLTIPAFILKALFVILAFLYKYFIAYPKEEMKFMGLMRMVLWFLIMAKVTIICENHTSPFIERNRIIADNIGILYIFGVCQIIIGLFALGGAYNGKVVYVKKGSSSGYSNIDSALDYFDTKLSMMTNKNASEEIKKIGMFANMSSFRRGNENIDRAVDFIDTKMSMMTNENRVRYLKGEKLK